MSNDYATAWDELCRTIGAAKGQSTTTIDDVEHLTTDQRLKVAEISALLSVAQEISAMNPRNVQYRDKDGQIRLGWGQLKHDDSFGD